jgi:hypothetical protein
MMIAVLSSMLHANTWNAQADAEDNLPGARLPNSAATQPRATQWHKAIYRGLLFGVGTVCFYILLLLVYIGIRKERTRRNVSEFHRVGVS